VNVLLIDIGNTRIKWARFDGKRVGRQHAAVHSGWANVRSWREADQASPQRLSTKEQFETSFSGLSSLSNREASTA